jgi:hypothetical protein
LMDVVSADVVRGAYCEEAEWVGSAPAAGLLDATCVGRLSAGVCPVTVV